MIMTLVMCIVFPHDNDSLSLVQPHAQHRPHSVAPHVLILAKPCEFKCFRRTDYDKINEGTPHTLLVFHTDLLLEPCCDLIFSLTAVSGLTLRLS